MQREHDLVTCHEMFSFFLLLLLYKKKNISIHASGEISTAKKPDQSRSMTLSMRPCLCLRKAHQSIV